jgi:hypothetical protein
MVHYTIVAVDVDDFAHPARTKLHHVAVHTGLYGVLETAFDAAGVPWAECRAEDRGDGVLIVVPARFPKASVVDQLPNLLVSGLARHNAVHAPEAHIKLRMAVHFGEVRTSGVGIVGAALDLTFRILDARAVRSSLQESSGVLAMAVSDQFFDEIVRVDAALRADDFQRIPVTAKQTDAVAWLRILGNAWHAAHRPLAPPPAQVERVELSRKLSDGRAWAVAAVEVGGSVMVVEGRDNSIRLYRAGSPDWSDAEVPSAVFSIAKIPGTNAILSGGRDGIGRIHSLPDLRQIGSLQGHREQINSVATAYVNGRAMGCTASDDGTIRVWDLVSPESGIVLRLEGFVNAVAIATRADGQPVIVAGSSGA